MGDPGVPSPPRIDQLECVGYGKVSGLYYFSRVVLGKNEELGGPRRSERIRQKMIGQVLLALLCE